MSAVCKPCLDSTGELVTVVARPYADGSGADYVCESDPPHVVGSYLDGGTIDLNLIRERESIEDHAAVVGWANEQERLADLDAAECWPDE